MGLDIQQEQFSQRDYQRFTARLDQSYSAIRDLLSRPGFGEGPASMGAELELSLVNEKGRPALANQALLADLQDVHFTAEINRFNLEFNSDPFAFQGTPFTRLGDSLRAALETLSAAAERRSLRPVTVGILPSLRQQDLGPQVMTDMARYRVLNQLLREHRKRPFLLNINGAEPLIMEADDVTYEGANTSLQIHLKVDPARFVATFNAAQMALGPVLAACGNSPFFLQQRLWQETRIVVFKQAVDDRDARSLSAHHSSRVGLGKDWWQGDLADCLIQHWQSYDPLLPTCSEEDFSSLMSSGAAPKLAELCTHNGTIWHWNRPVYDSVDGGHLRIEFRALPSGPSVRDMQANAALMLGLSLGLAESGPDCAEFPFEKMEFNLYRGAQNGLAAQFLWPDRAGGLSKRPATELIQQLLPLARRSLLEAGIESLEIERHLGVIAARLENGQTGAVWQHEFLTRTEIKRSRDESLRMMIRRYDELSRSGLAVHEWPLP